MRTPSSGTYKVWTDHLLYPRKASSAETGFHSVEYLAGGDSVEIPIHLRLMLGQSVALWKLTVGPHCCGQHLHIIEPRESKLLPAWSLHPYALVSLAWEGTLQVTERETWHQLSHKNLDLQSVLPASYAGALLVQKLREWPYNVWLNLRLMQGEAVHALSSLDG